jgi:hypothetical protein
MTIPSDKREQAIYHTILSHMHRIRSLLLNLQMIDNPSDKGISDHFARERTLTLGKLAEWKQRRPDLYREATEDFQHQVREP